MIRYLTVAEVLEIHHKVIIISGGSFGMRDEGLLESAVMRPQATFGGQDLYPDLAAKAAAMMQSIVKNHALVDGNKRTALISAAFFLRKNGCEITASENEKFDLAIQVAKDLIDFAGTRDWFVKYCST